MQKNPKLKAHEGIGGSSVSPFMRELAWCHDVLEVVVRKAEDVNSFSLRPHPISLRTCKKNHHKIENPNPEPTNPKTIRPSRTLHVPRVLV